MTLESKDICFIEERLPNPIPEKFLNCFTGIAGFEYSPGPRAGRSFVKNREETIFSKDEGLKRRKQAAGGAV